MRILIVDDLPSQPWKNGGGITRDIAQNMTDGQLLWLLSLADVTTPGPFSHFEGLARILSVVAGAGMVLRTPGGDLPAAPGVPVAFRGDLAVRGLLPEGPVRALNLIFDPRRLSPTVTPVSGAHTLDMPDSEWALYVIAGEARTLDGLPLAPGSAAVGAGRAEIRLAPDTLALSFDLAPAR